MKSWEQLLSDIQQAWSPVNWCPVGVVVGCSGGADSVALLRALAEVARKKDAQGFLIAAHFHHGLRGNEADGDAKFVSDLAEQLGIAFQIGHAQNVASDESTMRNSRLDFLQQTAQQSGARYVAVAHSAEDNVETVLHQLFRGTGPRGLCGIAPFRCFGEDPIGQDLVLMRPLLSVRRELIRDALRSIGQTWREDSSNANTDYRRNWIRQELLPLIESEYPSAIDSVGRTINSQTQWRQIMDRLSREWTEKHVSIDSVDEVTILRDPNCEGPVLVHAMQVLWARMQWPQVDLTANHWRRITDSISNCLTERYTLPGRIDVVCEAKGIVLSASSH